MKPRAAYFSCNSASCVYETSVLPHLLATLTIKETIPPNCSKLTLLPSQSSTSKWYSESGGRCDGFWRTESFFFNSPRDRSRPPGPKGSKSVESLKTVNAQNPMIAKTAKASTVLLNRCSDCLFTLPPLPPLSSSSPRRTEGVPLGPFFLNMVVVVDNNGESEEFSGSAAIF